VAGTDSESCPMTGFGISGVKPMGSGSTVFVDLSLTNVP
jgi:hypothetical protein